MFEIAHAVDLDKKYQDVLFTELNWVLFTRSPCAHEQNNFVVLNKKNCNIFSRARIDLRQKTSILRFSKKNPNELKTSVVC